VNEWGAAGTADGAEAKLFLKAIRQILSDGLVLEFTRSFNV
jgi:hypothetical protein